MLRKDQLEELQAKFHINWNKENHSKIVGTEIFVEKGIITFILRRNDVPIM